MSHQNARVLLLLLSLLFLLGITFQSSQAEKIKIQAFDHAVIETKSPLISNETALPLPLLPPDVETINHSLPTTHFMHGDSFAGEWKLALPLIEEARNMTFILHSKPGIIWFTPRNGYFRNFRASPGAAQEIFGEVMQGFWDAMLARPGNKVVFLVTPTIYIRSFYIDKDNEIRPGELGWKDEIVASIFEFLDPMLQRDPHLRFVNLLAHSFPYSVAGCGIRESDLSNCEPQKQSIFPGEEDYLLALSELEDIWGDRFLKVSIQDIVCPNQICTAGDENGRPMYKDSMHLRPEWLRDHIEILDARLAPFY